MIAAITRHGIIMSGEVPHTYMAEIDNAVHALRSRFTENPRKSKTLEQRRADKDHALKTFSIF